VEGDIAFGSAGFGGDPAALPAEAIMIPLSVPSAFRTVAAGRIPYAGPPPETGARIHGRFFRMLHPRPPPREMLILPIVVEGRTAWLLYAEAAGGAAIDEDEKERMRPVLGAAEEALPWLMAAGAMGGPAR
jgi:hypothetical protein